MQLTKSLAKLVFKYFFIDLNKIGEINLIFQKHDPDQNISEIMSSFIMQFYENKNVPKLIILNLDIKDKKIN